MSSRLIHIVACHGSFLFKAELCPITCIHHILFIHSSDDKQMGCSHILAIVNGVAMNRGMQISLWEPAFNSLGYVPRSRIPRPHGGSIFSLGRTLTLSSTAAKSFYSPTKNSDISPFSQTLVILCGFFFYSSHSNGCELIIIVYQFFLSYHYSR